MNSETVLNSLFDYSDLTRKTRDLFSCFASESDYISEFEDLFSVSYKLVFGNISFEDGLYYLLKNYYRNEYFIKRKFSSSVIAGERILMELPVADCRADIVSVKKAYPVCYEIKTKFDNLSRLEHQIETYEKVFPYIYVICSEDKLARVEAMIPAHCGIYSYKDRTNFQFLKKRNAQVSTKLDSLSILNCFRKSELEKSFGAANTNFISSKYDISSIEKKLAEILRDRVSSV